MKTALYGLLMASAICVPAALVQNGPNNYPDPYNEHKNFFQLPNGRHMGSTNTVHGDSKGNIWIVERCGGNDCKGSDLDPIMEFKKDGTFIKAFGKGKLLFPHGFTIDKNDHLWVVDNHNDGKIGDDVIEFDTNGKVLKTLGTPGVAGNDYTHFHEPNAVAVADNGVGIPAENLTKIFNHGFTTKKDGHGFGLHSSANAAREMGGLLVAESEGRGRGAIFTLELPIQLQKSHP